MNIGNNPLEKIPEEIANLRKLIILAIGDCSFDPRLFSENDIKSLGWKISIEGRILKTTIPPELWQLKNLRALSICSIFLPSLSHEIANLSQLEVLLLYNNQLSEIPPEIGSLTKLQELAFSCNQIKEIPPEIGFLINLQKLYFSYNKIKEIPLPALVFSNRTS